MSVLAFDTETHLIAPGLLAPPLVCVQWASPTQEPSIVHRDNAKSIIEEWLAGYSVLVGHNIAYDMAVIGAQWPDLLPAIFAKYDRDEVTDTLIREQLIMISRGTFRSAPGPDGDLIGIKYSLDDCYHRHFGDRLRKDGWRLFYRVFDNVPHIHAWAAHAEEWKKQGQANAPEWAKDTPQKDWDALMASDPSEAVTYALTDARVTLALYESQERMFSDRLHDQFRQARAAFALHLSSCWGVHTDPEAVTELSVKLRGEFESVKFQLQEAGLIRADGTADTKAAMAAMIQACADEGLPVICTKKGRISLSAEACERFDNTSMIGLYSEFQTLRKTLSNDIKMLQKGFEDPIQPRYDLTDTGRSRAAKPPIQAINRGEGIREAFRPRPGAYFIQADFEGLELHTLAAWCLEKVGWSKLAEDLNAKKDVHLVVAADFMGISYEEALARKKAGDPSIKEMRQRAKAVNFGFPGGLGTAKLVLYAKNNYGVILTEAEAKAYREAWIRRYPEMLEHFRLASAATNNMAKLGDEEHIFTRRMRSNVRYTSLCNGRFQGLGADAAKEALWRVTKACYIDALSPLYGSRVVAFVHDEIIAESPTAKAAGAAKELGRVMCEGANVYLSRVPVRTEPLSMIEWSKKAEPIYDEHGALVPWGPRYTELVKIDATTAREKYLAHWFASC